MLARILPLIAVALIGVAHAAPAPFSRSPDFPEVEIVGSHPDRSLAEGAPRLIVCQSDYQSVAKVWGISNPPKVDFRTHFLLVSTSTRPSGRPLYNVDNEGDLRVMAGPLSMGCKAPPESFNFRIKSFRRSAVRSVDGLPLPKK
jgi:hypothetical protein